MTNSLKINQGVWEEIVIIGVLLETSFPWRPPFIGDPLSLETPDFYWRPLDFHRRRPQVFVGDPRFVLETLRFSLGNPDKGISNENIGSSMRIWRSPMKIWGLQKNLGSPMKILGLQRKYGGLQWKHKSYLSIYTALVNLTSSTYGKTSKKLAYRDS